MKAKKIVARSVALTMSVALCAGTASLLAGCTTNYNGPLVIMTEDLNELFNPFFSTSGTDMDVVGQTQLSMFTTDKNGDIAYGEDEATVVLDYKQEYNADQKVTDYYFVLKNGIKYSDGIPLTMNDVMFNIYVYLDPAYTGSSTMYSTDIVGLQQYRSQSNVSGSEGDDTLTVNANAMAQNRNLELITLYRETGTEGTSFVGADAATMRTAISEHIPSDGYKRAIAVRGEISDEDARKQLLEDYNKALEEFRTELENDYDGAQYAYTEAPYNQLPANTFDPVTSFMAYEGYVEFKYKQEEGSTEDRTQLESIVKNYSTNVVKDRTSAIQYVFDGKVTSELDNILQYWATGTTLQNDYATRARDVILHERLGDSGELLVKNVSGITSLGHTGDVATVTIGSKTYNVAKNHNEDGTVADEGTYDVLRIQINGQDPKAIWNFGFSVAPHHYYGYDASTKTTTTVDIANNKFGVEWATYNFMTNVIQGTNSWGESKNRIPVGAGPYVATNDEYNTDQPAGNAFFANNYVNYHRNDKFLLGAPKIERMRYMEVSVQNAIGYLQSGAIHYVSPQLTPSNYTTLNNMEKDGYVNISTWQLGYGYIGINAARVTNINLRRAIMASMNTSLALQYYRGGDAVTISWPMSVVSWAYPRTAGGYDGSNPLLNRNEQNGHAYTQFTGDDNAKKLIQEHTATAKAQGATDSDLTIKFVIAGANLTDHPAYNVFLHARELLNDCGWHVSLEPDVNALTKLSTGSLAVWAAAWGSTIDPDMYQVYHKNSTASSTLAWGYNAILANRGLYSEETRILNSLSELIDQARETLDQSERAALYEQAMGYVLDLSVELPLYQRKTVYAYNANIIDVNTLPKESDINSYNSPLARLWEVNFVGAENN